MAKALRVAMEIVDLCAEKNYELDYFKLQKLTCLCQLAHYSKHQVSLSPEKMNYWTLGPSYKEIYSYFCKMNYIDKNKITNDMVRKINKEKHCIGELLYFERQTINYVIEEYADKNLEDLVNLCINDDLYRKIDHGDVIELHKLNKCYEVLEKKHTLKYTTR